MKPCSDCGNDFEPKNHLARRCPGCQRIVQLNFVRTWRINKQKKYRSCANGKMCACGNPAVIYKKDSFVCQRCLDIEEARAQREVRRANIGVMSFGIPEYKLHLP